jgi:hypothetical protein
VVAGYDRRDVFVRSFDAAGAPVARTIVDVITHDTLHSLPSLTSRPNGGPLLIWSLPGALRAAVIAADGRSATPPFDLTATDGNTSQPSAAYVGDAFYVAHSIFNAATDQPQLHLIRVEVDGRISRQFDALPAQPVYDPILVTGADDLRVVYAGTSPPAFTDILTALWQRIDAAGGPATPPVMLAADPYNSRFGLGIAYGRDTVVLLVSSYPESWMGIVRLASDGGLVMPLRKIAMNGEQNMGWNHQIVRRGSDAIVSWMSSDGKLQLARAAM